VAGAAARETLAGDADRGVWPLLDGSDVMWMSVLMRIAYPPWRLLDV
jgi:hypothetical protein